MNRSLPPPLPDQAGTYCQGCNALAPTQHVMFFQHIGAILLMFNRRVRGRLCRSCVDRSFAHTTLVTSFFGWWGLISFILTPIFLIHNLIRYLLCLRLKAPENTPSPAAVMAWVAGLCAVGMLGGLYYLISQSPFR